MHVLQLLFWPRRCLGKNVFVQITEFHLGKNAWANKRTELKNLPLLPIISSVRANVIGWKVGVIMCVFCVFLMFKQMPLNMRSFLQTEVAANEATFIDSHTFTDTNTYTHTLSLSLSPSFSTSSIFSLISYSGGGRKWRTYEVREDVVYKALSMTSIWNTKSSASRSHGRTTVIGIWTNGRSWQSVEFAKWLKLKLYHCLV